jgi:hypothetical protein
MRGMQLAYHMIAIYGVDGWARTSWYVHALEIQQLVGHKSSIDS